CDVRRGERLTITGGKRMIPISVAPDFGRDELVTGNLVHHPEHRGIGDVAPESCKLLAYHSTAGLGWVGIGCVARQLPAPRRRQQQRCQPVPAARRHMGTVARDLYFREREIFLWPLEGAGI